MTQREIAALICKGIGLYTLINGLSNFPAAFLYAVKTMATPELFGPSSSIMRTGAVLNVLPSLVMLVVGFLVWFSAEPLALSMTKKPQEPTGTVAFGREGQIVVFSSLGLWTLLDTIPKLAKIFIKLFLFSRQDPMIRNDTSGMTAPEILVLLIQLGLGLWLLFGAAGIVGIVRSIRSVGRDGSVGRDDGTA